MSAHHNVTACLQRLAYDFERFALRDFIHHVAAQRQRPIHVHPHPLSANVFGMWIPTPDVDYIIFNNSGHPTHSAHHILHEIAHIVLDHPRLPFESVLPPDLLNRLKLDGAEGCVPRTLARRQTPEEQGAEEFVFQIQTQVIQAQRLRELTAVDTSIDSLRPLLNTSAS